MISETNNREHDKISVQANVLCVERSSSESVSHEDRRHTESHQCVLNAHVKLTPDSDFWPSQLLQWTPEIQSFMRSSDTSGAVLELSNM